MLFRRQKTETRLLSLGSMWGGDRRYAAVGTMRAWSSLPSIGPDSGIVKLTIPWEQVPRICSLY